MGQSKHPLETYITYCVMKTCVLEEETRGVSEGGWVKSELENNF